MSSADRRWRGKGAVILDALVEAAGETTLPDTGDSRADLRLVIRAVVAELADPALSATTRAVTIETLGDEELAGQARDRLLRPRTEAIKIRLRAGRAAGQLRADADLDQAAEALIGPPYHRGMLRTGPLTEAYADGVVDLALTGLTPR